MSPAALPTICHPTPPSPTQKTGLNIPRSRRTLHCRSRSRSRRKAKLHAHQKHTPGKQLQNLFDRENDEQHPNLHQTTPLEEQQQQQQQKEEDDGASEEEEKWRFQAEMLRAECNFLRMEREIVLKKFDNNRTQMETTLRSAVDSLPSGRKKISDGDDLKEEMGELAEKLEELHKSSSTAFQNYNRLSNCSNFDTKANLLQRHLEDLRGENRRAKHSHESKEESSSIGIDNKMENKPTDMGVFLLTEVNTQVESLRTKMEECSSVVTGTGNSSASTSKRITDQLPEVKCTGRCKTVVRRVVEQVRAETEQWSQMQAMLTQVKAEMEELQAARDFWENRAQSSESEIQSLRNMLEEWKEKALANENKADELQLELYAVKWELQKSKAETKTQLMAKQDAPTIPLGKQLKKEKHVLRYRVKNYSIDEGQHQFGYEIEEDEERTLDRDSAPLSLGKQIAKEKKMFTHRLKENRHASRSSSREEMPTDARSKQYTNRSTGEHSPLRNIGNSSYLARQSNRSTFDLHCHDNFRTRESFRK